MGEAASHSTTPINSLPLQSSTASAMDTPRLNAETLANIEKAIPATGTFIGGLLRPMLTNVRDMDWERVNNQIGSLTSEATIATFLAAVQSQVIALSYQDNSSGVKVATNVLGFAGVLLDVITAFLALLSSTILQRHITVVEKQLASMEDATPGQLTKAFHFLTMNDSVLPRDMYRHLYVKGRQRLLVLSKSQEQDQNPNTEMSQWLTMRPESTELNIPLIAASCAHIQSAAFIGDAAGTAMLLGILCFFASVQCLAVATQPPAVWIVSTVICSFILILPAINRFLGLIGISKLSNMGCIGDD
ncbi:hypothetical protein GGX14DRAFT_402155 [Mycena pura]|uniref:Transmembrane protein n=1 Tax=Mycena pura TaxID=153505 RepID=A0AAD6UYC8_9AGAR|nr:hypothetical protein GGX14DRAFT_402155 [Mycena pura]